MTIPFFSQNLSFKRCQAIVFDLDDTLYPERDFVLSGFRAVSFWAAEYLGISQDAVWTELKTLFEGGVRNNTFNQWLVNRGFSSNEIVPQMVQVYRDHIPSIEPFSEVPSLLTSLHDRYRLGMISDGNLTTQKAKLVSLGLARFFDAVVFSDEWGANAWKPSTRPFEETVLLLGVLPSECVYVADNPTKDFLGARRAGMSSIRLRHPAGIYSNLEPVGNEYSPDLEISKHSELISIFLEN